MTMSAYAFWQVEPQTWLKQLTGTTRSGMILRDVSFEVHSGEIMAILGSKGEVFNQ
jgi:ABC-type transporter Mla maintaining outer membrane lipid asymmetry ATPase subunit MlaF